MERTFRNAARRFELCRAAYQNILTSLEQLNMCIEMVESRGKVNRKEKSSGELDKVSTLNFYNQVTQSSSTEASSLPSIKKLFPQLLVEEEALPKVPPLAKENNPQDIIENVDKLLKSFEDKSAPILPRIDIINEALCTYLEAGRFDRVQEILLDMPKKYGIKPNDRSVEFLASAFLKSGKPAHALKLVQPLRSVSELGNSIYNSIILGYFKRGQDDIAWKVYNELRVKCLPSPKVSATMLMRCGKLDQVERALLLYKELSAQGMTANPECFAALIYVQSKRKEYFSAAFDMFRQMELFKMPINLTVYNNLLYGCAKVADLSTALLIWRSVLTATEETLRPNTHTCVNFLWALAAVETPENKISKRNFAYKTSPESVVEAAEEVYQYMLDNEIPIGSHLLSALLAIYSNLRIVGKAESLFWEAFPKLGLSRNPFTYELMFKLYDNVKDYKAATRVYSQLEKEQVKVPYEGWRALARSAALYTLQGTRSESLSHIKQMISQGYKPTISDFKTVLLRLHERERPDLVEDFKKLCKNDQQFSPNPFLPWLNRSQSLGSMLKTVYGKDAPEPASKVVLQSPKKSQ